MALLVAQNTKELVSPKGDDIPDWFLWVTFRSGDREALEKLYCRHGVGMYRYGMHICRDSDLVKDGIQDLFSRLWGTRTHISEADSVQLYLYRSLRRLLLLQVTRNRRRNIPFEESKYGECPENSIEERVINQEFCKEQVARLRKEVCALSKHQREVVLLRFFNGLSYSQTAEIMELHVDSVYNLMSKAMDVLRARLKFENVPL